MRTIDNINRAKITNNVYVNTLSATQPLLITDNNDTASTISINGLNGYGSSNQIIQVNSAGDALEYTDKFLEASGGTLKVKSNTAYNYFQIKQDSSSTAGFQMTNNYLATGSTQNAYLYLDPTTNNLNIESNGERIKFSNTDIKFINSRDREMLFYDNDIEKLTLNNNGDKLFIQSCNLIEVDASRRFMEHTPAPTNLITIGNPNDTISIVNGSATISLPTSTSNTTLVGTDVQQTLTQKTLTSPIISTIVNAGATLTLPTITTTLVGTNTSDTLTNKTLTDPIIGSIKTLAGNNLVGVNQFSGLSLGNTTDNTSIFSLQSLQNTNSRDIFTYTSNTLTFNNNNDSLVMNGSGISGNLILDEDNMASNSNTKLATQQSIKAYVDSKASLFQNSTSGTDSIENIDKSTPRYIKLGRNTETNDCGFWIQTIDTGITKNAYMFLLNSKFNFQNDFNNKFKFYSSSGSIAIENPSDLNMLSYTGSVLTIGNSTDTISIINSTGTLSLPTTNDTLVGRLTTDTLENKTLKLPILYSSATEAGILKNRSNRTILKYTEGNYFSFNTLQLNNNDTGLPDILNIYGVSRLNSRQDKDVFINTTDNELEFGNTFDLVKFNHNGFQLKDANGNIVMSNQLNTTSNKYNTVFSTGADTDEDVAVSIRNKSGASYGDCRLRLRNVDTTSTSSNAVIEFLQNDGTGSYEGSYIFQSASTYDLLIQSSNNIGFYDNNAITAFFTNKSLQFQNSTSDIKGTISASTHPHNTTQRMRNIYCNEVVCVSPISENDTISYQAFNSKYPLTSIRGLNETGFGPGDSRNAMLELGTEQQTTANDNIYPIMRINSPAYTDSEYYAYIQSNSNLNDYYGWAYSFSGTLNYYLEFNSNYQVIAYQDLICTQDVDITGNLSKGTGSFKIKHPIKAEADKNKKLIHSFVEAPRCDNIYSGKIQLKNGKAVVNLDNNDWYKMTSGTFNKLNKDLRVYVNNNDFDNWDLVKGRIEGNKLIIISNNPKSTILVDWLIIGTRQDTEVKESIITDDNGDLITEIIETNEDNVDKNKNKTRKTKEVKKQDKMDRINHSNFKKLSKRLEKKTKINNGLHTAKKLIDTNKDKKKKKKVINEPQPQPTDYKKDINN